MLKKRNVRPIKGFVRLYGTFLSSAQGIRHKCRDSSGTHFEEPLQTPESFGVLLSATLFLKKFSPIFFHNVAFESPFRSTFLSFSAACQNAL